MKILITHTDLDGYGGNILESLFHDKLGFDSVYNFNYGLEETDEVKELIKPENDIIMMDLSIPEQSFIEWRKVLHSFYVYDHHTSSEYLSHYLGNYWDTEMCGTKLFWTYYVLPRVLDKEKTLLNNVQKLVDIIDTYDRWQEDSSMWETAKRLMKVNMGMPKRFTEHMVEKVKVSEPDVWNQEEFEIILKKEQTEKDILDYLEKDIQIRTDNSGHTFTIVQINYVPAVSVCCSEFLKKHAEIDYMIVFNQWKKKMSWRSKKDIDLTQIHGVFGHKAAAGSEGRSSIDELNMYGMCPRWISGNERKSKTVIVEKCKYCSY